MEEAEERLDEVFVNAFETNHPAMLDWVAIKFKLKEISRLQQQNSKLVEALNLFTEYMEVYGDKPYYAIPKVKIEIAKKLLEKIQKGLL